ncbi:hypothetical protein NHF50_01005 [Flavobacterium sp. NRK F10]|uniref:hypothetical protein n=1 Tax=Flavobacterium sp. NRK F10 TaxID=2954931 RepID=UPI002090F23C|nr:hypothetical protein [Flavobacterium sp. NRK F10]MCO6173614.1 hypothetical protein [Flavobacterium sp. NRK F10]
MNRMSMYIVNILFAMVFIGCNSQNCISNVDFERPNDDSTAMDLITVTLNTDINLVQKELDEIKKIKIFINEKDSIVNTGFFTVDSIDKNRIDVRLRTLLFMKDNNFSQEKFKDFFVKNENFKVVLAFENKEIEFKKCD